MHSQDVFFWTLKIMTNVILTFQNRVTQLQPQLILALAAVAIAAGLFAWLGGLGLKRTMYFIIGAFFGAFCTLLSAHPNIYLTVALIGGFAFISLKLQESFLMLVVSAFAAVIGYSILIKPYFRPSNNLVSVMRQIAIGVPYYNWPILMAVTAAPFAIISWRGASALFSSAAGALLILAGTIMILLNNGFEAAININSKKELYLEALAMMVIVGIFLQLWLLPKLGIRFTVGRKAAKARVKQIKAKKGEEGSSNSATWRTA